MPRLLNAHLAASRVPTREALQTAIRALGFKLVVEDAYVPFEASGYMPCTLEGEDAGVYLRFERVDGTEDVLMQLRWGGDDREHLTACVWGAALAQDCGAQLSNPDTGEAVEASTLLKKARQLKDELF